MKLHKPLNDNLYLNVEREKLLITFSFLRNREGRVDTLVSKIIEFKKICIIMVYVSVSVHLCHLLAVFAFVYCTRKSETTLTNWVIFIEIVCSVSKAVH